MKMNQANMNTPEKQVSECRWMAYYGTDDLEEELGEWLCTNTPERQVSAFQQWMACCRRDDLVEAELGEWLGTCKDQM